MTPEECKLLGEVDRGTPMGELLRRYWMPALLSRELEADGAPVRVEIMGEKLIAFRDTKGRVGLLREFCAHRGASLYFGRNGEDGLRCWYHGWKWDVDGKCLDQPNMPQERRFCDKVRQVAYTCVEKHGVVWTYMGPQDDIPPMPELEWLTVPEGQAYCSKRLQLCHWTQGMDGDLDSSHLGFLHASPMAARSVAQPDKSPGWVLNDVVPKMESVPTESGLLLGSRRRADEDSFYWRVNQWFMPNMTTIPLAGDSPQAGHSWVPIDGERSWVFTFSWHPKRKLTDEELQRMRTGSNVHAPLIPGTFLPKFNKSNGWGGDAPATAQPWQRITDLQAQDMAMTESMGPLYDRTQENLCVTDMIIVQTRRRLMDAARHLAKTGRLPGFDAKSYGLRPFSVRLKENESWQDAVAEAIIARPETFRLSV
jgi:phenylpropionate dioxygenase-like ring-hydroxylating dioxygenase large terminal subunit